MKEVNYEYLKEQLKNTGFGNTLNTELANKIKDAITGIPVIAKQSIWEGYSYGNFAFQKRK